MTNREGPLVTVLITARNRPGELRRTLAELSHQQYRPIELVVIDDASEESLEPVVREHWEDARFVRNTQNVGLVAGRSAGMKIAQGVYVCVLDDDSSFPAPDAIGCAIERMQEERELGVITFLIHHGADTPEEIGTSLPERYVNSYIGCGHMIRREVIEDIGGYRDFLYYYGEEAEYSLRALQAGWRILFYPKVRVHHRVALSGRNQGVLLGYSFRNSLLTILLHLPWHRAALEGAWKLATYSLEAVRRWEIGRALWALGSFLTHFREAWRLRAPVSPTTLRLYDALRFTTVSSYEAFLQAPAVTLMQRLTWLREVWWCRRRARSFWDRRPGGRGTSETCSFNKI